METERVENRVRDLRNPEHPVRRIARKSGLRSLIANRRHRSLKAEDVYLASYPRSGNTWMKFVFADLVSRREISFSNADEVIPTVGEHASKRGDLRDGGRLLKTHEPFRGEYRRAIYILRDPRDVALSYQRYFEGFGVSFESTDEFATKFMAGLVGSYGSWMDHVESWFEARSRGAEILPLFYESLIRDPESLVAEAASFAGVETTAPEIARAVARNSAERMRQKEAESASYFSDVGWNNRSVSFVGQASSGGWKGQLSSRTLERLQPASTRYAELLEMETGLRAAGVFAA
ncbi:MAG: sulfotransferase domain-containing protein [Solirubrobacterales bacterium]|nr:sulfotransferase domain-containing protein [Solirubrobacterales bacterium]